MSSLWYEYLEESGGEVIACKYFSHVCRSLEVINMSQAGTNGTTHEIKYARNYKDQSWWPIKTVESLSEGWLKVTYVGEKQSSDSVWWNIRYDDHHIQSIEWCIGNKVKWEVPESCNNINIDEVLSSAVKGSPKDYYIKTLPSFEQIKVGGYLECWLEGSVGLVWPVKVLFNIGGRLKLAWFGCESNGKNSSPLSFVLFYLDHRLRALGWAKEHGWKYYAPNNAGITIAINNMDAFVRGSPGALCRQLCNESEPADHSLEEGWIMEAVDPINPSIIRPATVKHVLNEKYFLVEMEGDEHATFVGFSGLSTLMPANLSGVSGFSIQGLKDGKWQSHLTEAHPDKYAPHSAYFRSMDGDNDQDDIGSVFLPGCKLEAVHPWQKDQIHTATVTRCMEGNNLVWIRLDNDPDSLDFLFDPRNSTDLFPVGWCEMVNHPLILPQTLLLNSFYMSPLVDDEIIIYFHPQCFLGPFISRSAASQILPRFIGPGHCLPVFKEFFHLLLKVSHKPHKLKRLLQLDHIDDCHDHMATIAIPNPKSEYNNRNKHKEWLVEVAIRYRAIPEFCRQTALSIGACPWFITTQPVYRCSLGCDARLSAKACEKMSQQRRKRLFSKPLAAIGMSYRTLKARIIDCNNSNNTSSNSEAESSEEEGLNNRSVAAQYTIQTRGVRLPVCESRRRCNRRKPFTQLEKCAKPFEYQTECGVTMNIKNVEDIKEERGMIVEDAENEDLLDYAIDPTYLAGEIGRVTLASNPLHWTAEQVAEYLSGTDCRQLSSWLATERVDGPAFLLLTLPVLSTYCGMQLEAAIRLCKHVVSLKRAFIEQFTDYKSLLPPDL